MRAFGRLVVAVMLIGSVACSADANRELTARAAEPPSATAVASSVSAPAVAAPVPEISASASVSASAVASTRAKPQPIPEAELFKPRAGEKLCTIVRRKDDRSSTLPTLRQFEDTRGFVVRTLETQYEGTEKSVSAMATILYGATGNVLRTEVDIEADGVADEWNRYEYDSDGRLTDVFEDETPERQGFRKPVTVKGKLTGPGQTTGMMDVPDRYREPVPVAVPPSKLPFEGEISISVHDSHWFYQFDKRGLQAQRMVFLHGQLERGDKPEDVDRFVYDGAGRRVGPGYRYQAGKLVRSPAGEELEMRYEYDKDGRLSAAKRVAIKGGAVTYEERIQRLCP